MTGGKTTRGFNPQSHGKLWSIIPDPAPQIGELRVGELGVLFYPFLRSSKSIWFDGGYVSRWHFSSWWTWWCWNIPTSQVIHGVTRADLWHPALMAVTRRLQKSGPVLMISQGTNLCFTKLTWGSRCELIWYHIHTYIQCHTHIYNIYIYIIIYIYIHVCVCTPGPSKYPQNDVSVGLWLRYLCDQIHGGKICCMGEEKPLANLGCEGVIRLYARKMWSVLSVRKSKTWVR